MVSYGFRRFIPLIWLFVLNVTEESSFQVTIGVNDQWNWVEFELPKVEFFGTRGLLTPCAVDLLVTDKDKVYSNIRKDCDIGRLKRALVKFESTGSTGSVGAVTQLAISDGTATFKIDCRPPNYCPVTLPNTAWHVGATSINSPDLTNQKFKYSKVTGQRGTAETLIRYPLAAGCTKMRCGIYCQEMRECEGFRIFNSSCELLKITAYLNGENLVPYFSLTKYERNFL